MTMHIACFVGSTSYIDCARSYTHLGQIDAAVADAEEALAREGNPDVIAEIEQLLADLEALR